MKPAKTGEPVLGVMVTSRMLHAVLVRAEANGPVVVQRFVRHRNSRQGMAAATLTPSMANLVPELQEELSGNDFTLQIGEGAGGSGNANDLFLRSEFGEKGGLSGDGTGEAAERAANFMYELSEVLDECRKLGHERPRVAFCSGSAEMANVELVVLPKEKKRKPSRSSDGEKDKGEQARASKIPGREELFKLLKEQYKGAVEEDRVAFLPMIAAESGTHRYLALVPKANEPVAVTLLAMRKQKDERPPNARLLDSEASLYLGLARAMMRSGEQSPEGEPGKKAASDRVPVTGNTLLVRAGAEDTLLYFFEGDRLKHYESMRSLTTFDSPDTICSRVLLQQDEYGVEEVSRVFLLSEERERELQESFVAFFPDAEIRSIREVLPSLGNQASAEINYGALIPAVGVAMRLLDLPRYRGLFEEVNLLPRRLVRQKVELPFTWHVLALGVLLFCTALFFGARYVLMEQQIQKYNDMLSAYPPNLENSDPKVLQARIDSMQNAYNGYVHALAVLDTLLKGSDQWSRGLEQLSSETAAVRGIWVEGWTPGNHQVTLTGNATARDRVVQLAQHVQGSIQSVTFSEIRDWPVYTFNMKVPLENDLPEAAKYLREHALPEAQPEKEPSPDASEASISPTAPPDNTSGAR
ncbi:MAG TPA: hypothetical protein VFG50_09460 [Rhodothermales bacterium]|nr:hypothetical protein [Rhodothermales bacterium]